MCSDQETGGTCRVAALDSEVRYGGNVQMSQGAKKVTNCACRATGDGSTVHVLAPDASSLLVLADIKGRISGMADSARGCWLWEEKSLGRPSSREAKCEVGKDRQSGVQLLGAHIMA